MSLNFLDELDITSTGDTVLQGFDKAQDNFEWLDDIFHGYINRSMFRWKDADEIYIGVGVYHHEGTVNQLVYWNTELTFKLGSAGSNSGSDDLTASAFHYIYIDDSAVVTAGTKLLTETEFLNDTTAPTWNATKHGWYNGNDRCVFAVATSGASAVLEFFNDGGRYVMYGATLPCSTDSKFGTNYYDQTPNTTWDDCYFPIPDFSTKAFATIYVDTPTAATTYVAYRVNGSASTGIPMVWQESTSGVDSQYQKMAEIYTDSSGIAEFKYASSAASNELSLYCNGYYLPVGM